MWEEVVDKSSFVISVFYFNKTPFSQVNSNDLSCIRKGKKHTSVQQNWALIQVFKKIKIKKKSEIIDMSFFNSSVNTNKIKRKLNFFYLKCLLNVHFRQHLIRFSATYLHKPRANDRSYTIYETLKNCFQSLNNLSRVKKIQNSSSALSFSICVKM